MRKVYTYQDPMMVYHMKNILAIHGIECVVQGEYRRSGVGEIPPTEAWLELWILDDWRLVEAQQILDKAREDPVTEQETWRCPKCAEELEGQFDQCWKCGTERR
ncbi:MAG: DUF2007 domain-containing protein [Syntrophobacteraceae bacterium]|jgi:hypothetical protein